MSFTGGLGGMHIYKTYVFFIKYPPPSIIPSIPVIPYLTQGKQARKVNSSCLYIHIETSYLWAVFVIKNRRISVPLESEEDKRI